MNTMKQTCPVISTLLLVAVFFSANSFAQDYVHYATLKGNTGPVTSVVYSPDGRTIANGSSNEMVCLWDASTGQLKTILTPGKVEGGRYNTESVAYSPDGSTLAIGVGNGTVCLWDVTTKQYKAVLTVDNMGGLVSPIAYSPDGTTLAIRGFAVLDTDPPMGLWDPITGELKTTLTGYTPHGVYSMAYSPNGKIIATTTFRSRKDSWVDLWDARTGQLKTTLTAGNVERSKHYNDSVAYSPDGTTIASGTGQGIVLLWDVLTEQLKTTFIGHIDEEHDFVGEIYTSVAYSPDGTTIASGRDSPYNMVELWDARTGQLKTTLISPHAERRIGVTCLAYSPDGRTLAVGHDDKTIRLWRVSSTQSAVPNSLEELICEDLQRGLDSQSTASQTTKTLQPTANQIYNKAVRSVMWIVNPGIGEGSGILIDKKFGIAFTNAHVTGKQDTVDIYFPAPDEKGELIKDRNFYLTSSSVLKRLGYYTKGHVVAKDEKTDLAIIKLDGLPETTREIDWNSTTPSAKAGNLVYILGNPGGQDLWRWTLGEFLNDHGDFLHIQSDVFGGNSGGPVLNKQGVLLGIVARSDRHMNALAIPVRHISGLLSKSQLEHSRSRR